MDEEKHSIIFDTSHPLYGDNIEKIQILLPFLMEEECVTVKADDN